MSGALERPGTPRALQQRALRECERAGCANALRLGGDAERARGGRALAPLSPSVAPERRGSNRNIYA